MIEITKLLELLNKRLSDVTQVGGSLKNDNVRIYNQGQQYEIKSIIEIIIKNK